MSYHETPKPQSILHQIGRLGSRITKPRFAKSKQETKSASKNIISSPVGGEGVYTENGIVMERDDSGREDFTSVSFDAYEENILEDCDLLPPPDLQKCDGNSEVGKEVDKVFPSDDHNNESCSNMDNRRRSTSRRIDCTGLVA